MLDPAREQELERLFGQVLDQPPQERDAFVSRVEARDGELAARLRELLAEDARGSGGLLDGDLLGSARQDQQRIGPYRLLRILGEGGMGTVHLAEQDEPVRRTVALKTVRLGGGQEVLLRFDAERQALARLSHPNVARIYDAGTTVSGLPWFAMEYCPGRPLDAHCDHERLGIRERLELLLAVCDAVQHAHLRGVLHRDLKPANVLVTQRDGRPVPKVIDFGLAHAIAGVLSPQVSTAAEDRALGTWLYMSPEQADPQGDVDVRSDVWALGAMLFELLCGEPPFPGTSVQDVAAQLVGARVPAPSERLASYSPQHGEAVASARRTTSEALAGRLCGDLDAIVRKALERDRVRRYGSPAELAEDLRRHLTHRPVEAVRGSVLYRLGKLAARHRVAAVISAIAAVGLLGGLLLAWVQSVRAREAEAARLKQLQLQLSTAAARSELLQIALLEDKGQDMPLSELLARAEPAIATLHPQDPRGEAALRRSLGAIWLDLGQADRARLQLERAWVLASTAPDADEIERFLTLDGLIRARRAEWMEVERELTDQSVELALRQLQPIRPRLSTALGALFAATAAVNTTRGDASGQLDRVDRRLDELRTELRSRVLSVDDAPFVGRVLAESVAVLHAAWREEADREHTARLEALTDRVSRKLERVASETFDPSGSAWIYILWRLADAHMKGDPPLALRAHELAQQLLEATRRRGLEEDHWMVEAARQLLSESEQLLAAGKE